MTLAADDRVLMLANARVLGHTFDPLSVFWCLRPDGSLLAVVFEVHNTYGERHAYLLDVDETTARRPSTRRSTSPRSTTPAGSMPSASSSSPTPSP